MSTEEAPRGDLVAFLNGLAESAEALVDFGFLEAETAPAEGDRADADGRRPPAFLRSEDFLPVRGVSYHDRRANVSLSFVVPGSVALPDDRPAGLPAEFPTRAVRTCLVVEDGRLRAERLRARISRPELLALAERCGVSCSEPDADGVVVLNLASAPLFAAVAGEDGMLSGQGFVEDAWSLVGISAEERAIRWHLDDDEERPGAIAEQYGPECAEYLAGLGVTDAGYRPPKSAEAAPRRASGVELVVKFRDFSSLPSAAAVDRKLSAIEDDLRVAGRTRKRVTPSEDFVLRRMDAVREKKAAMAPGEFAEWSRGRLAELAADARAIRRRMSATRLAVVAGGMAFREWGAPCGVSETGPWPRAEVALIDRDAHGASGEEGAPAVE